MRTKAEKRRRVCAVGLRCACVRRCIYLCVSTLMRMRVHPVELRRHVKFILVLNELTVNRKSLAHRYPVTASFMRCPSYPCAFPRDRVFVSHAFSSFRAHSVAVTCVW